VAERIAAAVNGGTDVLSGFHQTQEVLDILKSGLLAEARADEAARRLLKEQFQLGLFENPYDRRLARRRHRGREEFRAKALAAQRKSLVLLQNAGRAARTRSRYRSRRRRARFTLYTMGLNRDVVSRAEYGGYSVKTGDYDAAKGQSRPSAAAPTTPSSASRSRIAARRRPPTAATIRHRANPSHINPATGRPFAPTTPLEWTTG